MEFKNQIRSKGEREGEGYYESVTIDGVTLTVGDLVVWSDPDCGMHGGECELIHSEEWVVEVTTINKSWNRYNDEWKLRIGNSGVGWIDWDGIAIPEQKGNYVLAGSDATRLVESFKESEYERYMYWQYHTGQDSTPEGLWEIYEKKNYSNSGPHCEYCMGDGLKVDGK